VRAGLVNGLPRTLVLLNALSFRNWLTGMLLSVLGPDEEGILSLSRASRHCACNLGFEFMQKAALFSIAGACCAEGV